MLVLFIVLRGCYGKGLFITTIYTFGFSQVSPFLAYFPFYDEFCVTQRLFQLCTLATGAFS